MAQGKKDLTQQNTKVKAVWGYWALGLFLVVMAILINIGLVSNKKSKANVEEKLSTETSAYATKLGATIESLIAEARGAGLVLSSAELSSPDEMLAAAKSLADESSNVYLAAVTDENGVGYFSTGDVIELSKMEYNYTGAEDMYSYIKHDGVIGKSAFVVAVPYKTDNVLPGYVYLYEDSETIFKQLPAKSYGNRLAFAIIDTSGKIIVPVASESYFNSGDNFISLLESSELEMLTLPQIRMKLEKLIRTYFYASHGEENRAVFVAQMNNTDWQLVTIIGRTYVDAVIKNNMSSIIRMIVFMIIALCLFVAFLTAIFFISKFKQKEESKDLVDKADTDLLTGLNNKIATERKIQEYMSENPNTQSLMFLFDIDNFKKINDTMGHSFGDEVLRTLGHQLSNEFRVTDIIGRLGGDEFVVLLKNIKNNEQLEREGQRITALFHQFKAGDYVKYSATASIGAVVFPRDAKDFQSAYKAADKALYEAKRRGKNQLVFYSDNLSEVKSIKADE